MIKFENISYVEIPSRQDYIDIVITKVFDSINKAVLLVNELNYKLGETEDTSFDVGLFGFGINLSIDEAIRNAVVHGNRRDPTKRINLSYGVSPSKLEITIEDDGDGFDVDAVLNGKIPNFAGRGILLLRNFMDKVIFNEKGNKVTMIKFRNRSGGGEDI
ncbi:MAG: ATP-binding protein [bacterium]|jgi:serine/threonine-protein kinase RsbW|nr:ATP-binding protein [bacterium]